MQESDSPPPFPDKPAQVSDTFQKDVLDRIHRHQLRRAWIQRCSIGSAAVLCAFILGRQVALQIPGSQTVRSPRVASADRGVQWLLEQQQPDGSWRASISGGHARFDLGVTSLATLALLTSPEPVPSARVEISLRFLEEEMKITGLVLGEGPNAYNQILALFTLKEAERVSPDPDRGALIEHALDHLVRTQDASGGWGYRPASIYAYREGVTPNSAVTWWALNLLQRTNPTPEHRRAIAKAEIWLSERFSNPDRPEYRHHFPQDTGPGHALYWMAHALTRETPRERIHPEEEDAYRDYLRTRVEQPEAFLEYLRKAQLADGRWQGDRDRWGRAGGDIYATALRILAQVPRGA